MKTPILAGMLGCSLVATIVGIAPQRGQAQPKPAGTMYALVIGVDEYEDVKRLGKLKYAEADAQALHDLLKAKGYRSTLLLGKDASKQKIEEEFQRLLKKGIGADTLLLAFSGHGQQFKPPGGKEVEPFLCTRECNARDSATQVAFNQLLTEAGDSKFGKTLFLVDACRVDPDPNKGGLDGNAVKLKAQTVALFAASNGQKAREHSDAGGKGNGHGLFMSEVLDALNGDAKNKQGKVTWNSLVSHITGEVTAKSKQLFPNLPEEEHQTPHSVGSLVGDAVLVDAATAVAAADDEKVEEFTWKGEKRKRLVRTMILGGEKVEFVQIPKGKCTMGSPASDKEASENEKPQHTVTFTKPLWVAKYPVTKGQFAAFVKAAEFESEAEKDGKGGWGFDGKDFKQDPKYSWKNTGWAQTDAHPVVNVSWNDAEAYAKWASKQGKKPVRLLSEAEYEYANRGGSETIYFTGDDIASLEGYANVSDKSAIAKFDYFRAAASFDDGYVFTSPVGTFKPNGFGLSDTTGNVYSWCSDWYDSKSYAKREAGAIDPKSNEDGEQKGRVHRGGSWSFDPGYCRAAFRFYAEPDKRNNDIGFRICFVLD